MLHARDLWKGLYPGGLYMVAIMAIEISALKGIFILLLVKSSYWEFELIS